MKASFSKTFAFNGESSVPVKAIDLFCGFGGATQGLADAGLEVALSVDFNKTAVRTHRALHPNVPCLELDVNQVRPSHLVGAFVWASPSCRPYSFANTSAQRGLSHREYFPLWRLVRQCIGAAVLVIENVPGLIYSTEGMTELQKLERECFDLGVSYQPFRVFASWFGLEQRRERVILVIGAPGLVSLNEGESVLSGGTVTTKGTGKIETLSLAQGVQNPMEVLIPDFRSGRRRSSTHIPALSSHAARRVVGNAVPPVMVTAIARTVLSTFQPQVLAAPFVSSRADVSP